MTNNIVTGEMTNEKLKAGKPGMKINPLNYLKGIKNIKDSDFAHVTYDPDLVEEYGIINGSSHDGTFIFTHENIRKCLQRILNKDSFFKPTEPNWDLVKDMKYTIGDLEIYHTYGNVKLPCGIFPGVAELVRLPVKCEYVFLDKTSEAV